MPSIESVLELTAWRNDIFELLWQFFFYTYDEILFASGFKPDLTLVNCTKSFAIRCPIFFF